MFSLLTLLLSYGFIPQIFGSVVSIVFYKEDCKNGYTPGVPYKSHLKNQQQHQQQGQVSEDVVGIPNLFQFYPMSDSEEEEDEEEEDMELDQAAPAPAVPARPRCSICFDDIEEFAVLSPCQPIESVHPFAHVLSDNEFVPGLGLVPLVVVEDDVAGLEQEFCSR